MKRFINSCVVVFVVLIVIFSGQSIFAQEAESESSSIGISVGMDYYSTYLWRGSYFYAGDGAFCPSLAYETPFGLTLTVAGELAASYIGDGKDNANQTSYSRNGLDAGADYSYSIDKTVTLGIGVWYWGYLISEDENGVADESFVTGTVSVAVDAVPLTPTLSFTYDYYLDEDIAHPDGAHNQDFYIQLGIGHTFELTKEAGLELGLAAGFYSTKLGEEAINGISDIAASVKLSVETGGGAAFSGSFNYVIVPTEDFYMVGILEDIHRFYATFGASYSI